jgi:hypothetical protein
LNLSNLGGREHAGGCVDCRRKEKKAE